MSFINLHFIQSIPASLMNRDDTDSAKSITVGNVRRDRISSQSWKKAMRDTLRQQSIENGVWGVRTKRLPREVVDILVERGRDRDIATAKTIRAFQASGISCHEEKPQTNVQLNVAETAKTVIADLVDAHFDEIQDNVPDEVKTNLIKSFDPDRVVDIALFGRLITELKRAPRIDGAVGVSHPFGVTSSTVESDYWTSTDDIQNDEDAASGNLGVSDLTAPVFYRHIFVDTTQLEHNLAGTDIGINDVLHKLINVAITASPTGKQNSTSAHTLPSVVIAERSALNISAASAFTTPIKSDTVLHDAIDKLTRAVKRYSIDFTALSLSDEADDVLDTATHIDAVNSIDELIKRLVN